MDKRPSACPAPDCRAVNPVQQETADHLVVAGVEGDWVRHGRRCSHCGCVYLLNGVTKVIKVTWTAIRLVQDGSRASSGGCWHSEGSARRVTTATLRHLGSRITYSWTERLGWFGAHLIKAEHKVPAYEQAAFSVIAPYCKSTG